jgi:hypothetical protein
MLDISMDASQFERAMKSFEDFPKKDFMEGLVELTLRQADRRFDSKEDPEGNPWKPWSVSYRRRGAPFHSRHTLLHLSGDLRDSIEPRNVTARRAEIVSELPYARRQNAERQFLGFVDDDPEMVDFAIGYMVNRVEAA